MPECNFVSMTWQENVKELLRQKSLSQERLAEDMGVSQGAINHWLSGRRKIDVDTLIQMANVLKTTASRLLDVDVEAKPVRTDAVQHPAIRDLHAEVSRLSESDAKKLLPIVERLTPADTGGTDQVPLDSSPKKPKKSTTTQIIKKS